MATKLWQNPIDKNVDWGGDKSTDYAPVSGEYIQKFIKDSLAKKFGYLYYNTTANKYYVFADEEDFTTWSNDTTGEYSSLKLVEFNAPAPGTIKVTNTSARSNTILFGSKQSVSITYICEDSSGSAVGEAVTASITIASTAGTKKLTQNIKVSSDYASGTTWEFVLCDGGSTNYLTAGENTITIVLEGNSSGAKTTVTFNYTAVALNFSCPGFVSKAIDYNESYISIPYFVSGAGQKYIEIFIDGEELYQQDLGYDTMISTGDLLTASSTESSTIELYLKNVDGERTCWPENGEWAEGVTMSKTTGENVDYTDNAKALFGKEIFSPGVHTLQMRVYTIGGTGNIYSTTVLYDFVVTDPAATSTNSQTFVMYSDTDLGQGAFFKPTDIVTFEGAQYETTSFNVRVYDSLNREVQLNYVLKDSKTDEEIATLTHSVATAESSLDEFEYTFQTYGDIKCVITNGFSNYTLTIMLKIEKSVATAEKVTAQLAYEYSALNRSNSEPNPASWVSVSNRVEYPASFNKVLWNKQSGWANNSLVLRNGATVTFPINAFELWKNSTLGFTFEIDFETCDVQTDDAVLLNYTYPNNNSYIKLTAVSGEMSSQMTKSIKTNFRDQTRTKIAFVWNPITDIIDGKSQTGSGIPNPNMMFIIVNGVLDRVCAWGDGSTDNPGDRIDWDIPANGDAPTLTIGDPEGKATIKLYSLRIYRKALTPEQEFQNYLADSSDIKSLYEKNDVFENEVVSIELVKKLCPVMVVDLDFNLMNNLSDKKKNMECDVAYYEEQEGGDPTRGFYCRNAWVSNQGTSSLQYPIRNFRLYFKKTNDKKTVHTANNAPKQNYETEFWPYSEYGSLTDYVNNKDVSAVNFDEMLPYACNSKTDAVFTTTEGYSQAVHPVGSRYNAAYAQTLAKAFADKGERLYNADGEPVKYGDLLATEYYYISSFRPIRFTGEELGSDEYFSHLKQFRYTGKKIYTQVKITDPDSGEVLDVQYKECKKKGGVIDPEKEYYSPQAYWKQYKKSGYTERWTIKADYAESSMTHNAGVGRLWGDAMANVEVNGAKVGQTDAQKLMDKYEDMFDIRTSCDGKPIVMFVRQLEAGFDEHGQKTFGGYQYGGLYNIMTDKGSTELFGFENIYDENGKKIFDAGKTQCWECLSNNSLTGMGVEPIWDMDSDDVSQMYNDGDGVGGWKSDESSAGRYIFKFYEPRWPDSGQERFELYDAEKGTGMTDLPDNFPDDTFGCPTTQWENFWNWMHFCKPAVNYMIDGHEGYAFSVYVELSASEAKACYEKYTAEGATAQEKKENMLYVKWSQSGNDQYTALGGTYTNSEGTSATVEYSPDSGETYYRYEYKVDMENTSRTINEAKIGDVWGGDVYVAKVDSFDSKYRFLMKDGTTNEEAAADYKVTAYLKRNGSNYTYVDHMGKEQKYVGDAIATDEYLVNKDGQSWKNSTFMQFFSETKYDHMDVYKVAAYYIYVIRFGAVDQMVKNTMTATEDGVHWYFINYDNDTILGVRNDGHLVFNWDFTRSSYDDDLATYSFMGDKSVMWNNLELDTDFMAIVQAVDNALYNGKLLDSTTVINLFNEKQCGVWCERLYNEQERLKYLSQFINDFNQADKYLTFMHGTRKSHRSWWIKHRWDLFDSKWQSGEYMQYIMQLYLLIEDASAAAPQNIATITSASEYYFMLRSNNRSYNTSWTKSLKNGVQWTYKTTTGNTIGDPVQIYGPAKLRVLDFRPGLDYLAGSWQLNRGDWVKNQGCMLTRFLAGGLMEGEIKETNVGMLAGIGDITSLEEIDIRGMKNLAAQPSIANLGNLHRFRAEGSNVNTFTPCAGATLYEVSLPDTILSVQMSDITFTEDAGKYDIVTAIEYASGANDGTTTPVYSLNADGSVKQGNYWEAYAYDEHMPDYTKVYTEGRDPSVATKYTSVAGEAVYFNYAPTSTLKNVKFSNVVGFDSKQFVIDWNAALLVDDIDRSSCTLGLANIAWDGINIDELIAIYEAFSISVFSGTITVTGTGEGNSLTEAEYNHALEVFGPNIFTPGNTMVFNAAANMFINVESGNVTIKEKTEEDTTTISGVGVGDKYYNIVRGQEIIFNATVFPVDPERVLRYTLQYQQPGAARWTSLAPSNTTDIASYVYENAIYGVSLKNVNGKGVLTLAEKGTALNFRISITDTSTTEIDKWSKDDTIGQYIYIKVEDQVMPTSMSIVGDAEIKDEVKRSYSISFGSKQETMNVAVTALNVTSSNNAACKISNIVFNNDTKTFTFEAQYTIQPETTTVTLTANARFNCESGNPLAATSTVTVQTINATGIEVYAVSDTEFANPFKVMSVSPEDVESLTGYIKIGRTGTTNYAVKILPEDYNLGFAEDASIKIDDGWSTSKTSVKKNSMESFDIVVKDNKKGDNWESFNEPAALVYTLKDKYGKEQLNRYIPLCAKIVYPEKITLRHVDIVNSTAETVQYTNTATLQILDGQGSNSSASNKIAPVQYFLNIEPTATDLGNVTEPFTCELQVTCATRTDDNYNSSDVFVTCAASDITHFGADDLGSGDNGFKLNIEAQTNCTAVVDVAVKYSIKFDGAGDTVDTADDKTITGTLNFTVEYSTASALTWHQFAEGEFYAIDNRGRYYKIDMSGNTITNGAKFGLLNLVGLGYSSIVSGTKVAIGFMPKSTDCNESRWANDLSSLANVRSTGNTIRNTSMFNGASNTVWLQSLLQDGNSNDKQTAVYYAIHAADGIENSNIETYLPSHAEVQLLLSLDLEKVDAIISALWPSEGVGFNIAETITRLTDKFSTSTQVFATSTVSDMGSVYELEIGLTTVNSKSTGFVMAGALSDYYVLRQRAKTPQTFVTVRPFIKLV